MPVTVSAQPPNRMTGPARPRRGRKSFAAGPGPETPGPAAAPLTVVQVTPEFAPAAKVGGLADMVAGLSGELARRGHRVEVILPKYSHMRYDLIEGLSPCWEDLRVPWHGGHIPCGVFTGAVHGRTCFFIDPRSQDNYFNRGVYYGCGDDVARFAFFCRAALEFLRQSGRQPDILHCHDWPTGLVPVLLYEVYAEVGMTRPRVCFTVHNFQHQGTAGADLLHALGLHRPEHLFRQSQLGDNANPGVLNLLKGGIVYANFVTTVSRRHAWEAKDAGQGFGLESTLQAHHAKYGGIVNGVDYAYWNPETDPYIPHPYGVDSIEEKYRNKAGLRRRLLLADGPMPIVAFVGRLDPQKGLDLVRHGLMHALGSGAQFVLLGSSPDPAINAGFLDLKRRVNDDPDCHLEIGFDEELAHLIYAGADMMIVPSRFEPCGLTQLIALRYGAVPIVREVGGLADTVVDKDFTDRPYHERNGYVFADPTPEGLSWAMSRAISCYYAYPEDFRRLIRHGMRADFSWQRSAGHYLDVYELIRAK